MSEEWLNVSSRNERAARVDSTLPNIARVWNYLVGGRDNFDADRRAAKQLVAASPAMADVAIASRAFLRRAVRYLAAEAGVRQFLDIGTGIPTVGHAHEVAQSVDPACRVVYVDNDPMVLSHARARLRSGDTGSISCLDADARDTASIVAGARETLDFGRPVGLILIGILNFVEDASDVVAGLVDALPPGSYLAFMHPLRDDRIAMAAQRWNQLAAIPVFLRDREQMARWLDGLDPVEPGLVEVQQWRPEPADPDCPGGLPVLGAVARKP